VKFLVLKITLKLFAGLAEYLPDGAYRNSVEVALDSEKSISQVIEQFNVPSEEAHLVLVNGVYCAPTDRDQKKLKEGDTLAIWPPVAGG